MNLKFLFCRYLLENEQFGNKPLSLTIRAHLIIILPRNTMPFKINIKKKRKKTYNVRVFMKRKLQCNRNCYRNGSLNSLIHSFASMEKKTNGENRPICGFKLHPIRNVEHSGIASIIPNTETIIIIIVIIKKRKKMKASLVMYPKCKAIS